MLVQGNAGAETLSGGASADTIIGGLGADRLTGGGGADLFKFAQGDSTVAAPDQVNDFQADDRLDFGLEAATAENMVGQFAASLSAATAQAAATFAANSALRYAAFGVGSNVHVFASDADGGQTASLVTLTNPGPNLSFANFTGFTPVNPNLFIGTEGAETLTGTASSDTILGNGGADTIVGGFGADRLTGGAGADLFKVGAGGSTLAAPDQITDLQADDRLDFGLEAATAENMVGQTAASLSAATAQAGAAFAANSALRYVAISVGSNVHVFASDADGGQTASLVTLTNPGPNLSFANFTGFTPVNPNLFIGTAGADTLIGTAGSDTIQGNGGADTIIGGLGADRLTGGAGADYFKIVQGDSTVAAPDQITDFQADDRLDFGLEAATMENTVAQTAGSVNVAASQASAAFAASSALRYVATMIGSNMHFFASDADGGQTASMVTLLNPGAGLSLANFTGTTTPQFIGGDGPDTLTGTASSDIIQGNGGNDSLSGEAGADTIGGGGGSDTLTGGAGPDSLTGGAGDDLFRFLAGSSNPSAGAYDIIADFDGGDLGSNTMRRGFGSGDQLDFGLPAADEFNFGAFGNGDYASALANANLQFSGGAKQYVFSQVGADIFVFARGENGQADRAVQVLNTDYNHFGFQNVTGTRVGEVIAGTSGADTLAGGSGNDTIAGGDSADRITGGRGVDVLTGGAGDDRFIFGAGTAPLPKVYTPGALDSITDFNGGTRAAGIVQGTGDQLVFGLGSGTAPNYLEATRASYAEAVTLADATFSAATANYLAVQVGSDVIVFYGTSLTLGAVQLAGVSLSGIGYANIDPPAPPADPHLITGTDAADLLTGTSTADTISAAGGADTIVGGQGADLLTGGADNDLFKFAEGDSTPANSDQITDFASGDRVDFSIVQGTATNYVENSAASLAAATTQATAAFAANSALRYVATQVGGDVQLFATDADGGEAHSLVTLKNLTTASIEFTSIAGSSPPPVDPYLLVGTEGADTLVGTAAPETINGLGGADTISGGGNADVVSGGGGDDLFMFAAGDSVYAASTPTTIASYGDRILDFEGGTRGTGLANGTGDQLDFGFVRGTATNYIENTAATQAAAVTEANAAFAATSALRYVATQVGGDVLVFASAAGGQAASLVTLSGADVGALGFLNIAGTAPLNYSIIDGTAGRDTLVGGAGNDSLTGFADRDTLFGGAGNDTLGGGDGQDTLTGGLGNDRISGGANEDRFVFGPGDSGQFFGGVVTPGTADIVTDFQTGIDVLTFGTGPADGFLGGNYSEFSTVFTTYASAETAAGTAFANQASLIYVVAQVGQDTYVFVDTGGTPDVDTVVYLQGVALSGIAATDIV